MPVIAKRFTHEINQLYGSYAYEHRLFITMYIICGGTHMFSAYTFHTIADNLQIAQFPTML